MKNIKMKQFLFLALGLGLFTSCVKDDEFDIPTLKEVLFYESFESTTPGGGTVENAIALPGWGNYAVQGSRKWHSRAFSNNKYAEFSSFYSNATTDPNDEIWLITPSVDLSDSPVAHLEFGTKARFWAGAALTVLVSTDYDGTQAGIATANWTELNPTLPTAQTDNFISSGPLDLSAYLGSSNVHVAFKYVGSRNGVTTTFQIDNVKIYEN